jgi:hypothetical protein
MSDQTQDTQIVPAKTQLGFSSDAGFEIRTLDEAWRMASYIIKAGFAPKGMETNEQIIICFQQGAELGLPKLTALQNIAVINGRPNIFGDLALGLVFASGLMEERRDWYEIDGKKLVDSEGNERTARADEVKNDSCTAFFLTKRKGQKPLIRSFSTADAKAAQLWGKTGPWTNYPARQMQWRARGFALRDAYPDVLKGLYIKEEAEDMPPHQGFENAKLVSPQFAEPKAPAAITAGNPPVEPVKAKTAKAKAAPEAATATTPETKAAPAAEAPVEKNAPNSELVETASNQPNPKQPSENQPDPCAPLLAKIDEAARTYDFTEADVLAFAKEKGILSPRNRMAMNDLSDNILALIVNQLPALIEKFTTEAAP